MDVQEVRVNLGTSNELLGSVKEDCSCVAPEFSVIDCTGTAVLKIEGPCCTMACCSDVQFPVRIYYWISLILEPITFSVPTHELRYVSIVPNNVFSINL